MCLCKRPIQPDTWTVTSFLDELTRLGDDSSLSYDGDFVTQEQDIDGFSEASFDPDATPDMLPADDSDKVSVVSGSSYDGEDKPGVLPAETSTDEYDSDVSYDAEFLMVSQ